MSLRDSQDRFAAHLDVPLGSTVLEMRPFCSHNRSAWALHAIDADVVGTSHLLDLDLLVDAVHGRDEGDGHEADDDAHEDDDERLEEAGEALELTSSSLS